VRHALVQRIVRAYESAKPQQQEMPLAMGEAIEVSQQPRENKPKAQTTQPAKPQ
jgi:phosphate starvation-inducible PhoH-like protein